MPTCGPCSHRNRDELDAQLIAGVSYRAISKTFQVSIGALSRHKAHVKEMIRERTPGEREEHGSALLDRVEKLVTSAEEILEAAKTKNDFRGANGALGAAAKLLDLLGRLSGELQSANAGGLHLTMNNRVTNTIVTTYDNDVEFAQLVSEATRGFNPIEIERLKALVNNPSTTPLLMR
jgi:hypothetical protein